jgi:hypothetical protein
MRSARASGGTDGGVGVPVFTEKHPASTLMVTRGVFVLGCWTLAARFVTGGARLEANLPTRPHQEQPAFHWTRYYGSAAGVDEGVPRTRPAVRVAWRLSITEVRSASRSRPRSASREVPVEQAVRMPVLPPASVSAPSRRRREIAGVARLGARFSIGSKGILILFRDFQS